MKKLIGSFLLASVVSSISSFGQADAYSIGDVGPSGGFIFYVDPAENKKLPAGFTYLEAAPVDQAEKSTWSNVTNEKINTTKTGLGAGASNTEAIVSQPGHKMSAARRCKEYVLNGFGGWFLPSKDELKLMFENICRGKKMGGFPAMGTYWSSSEDDVSANSAWGQQFYIEGFQDNFLKSYNVVRVRCARAF